MSPVTKEGAVEDEAPKKAKKAEPDASALTPSGVALAEAGEPPADDASDEEKSAWHDSYLEAKLKARRG